MYDESENGINNQQLINARCDLFRKLGRQVDSSAQQGTAAAETLKQEYRQLYKQLMADGVDINLAACGEDDENETMAALREKVEDLEQQLNLQACNILNMTGPPTDYKVLKHAHRKALSDFRQSRGEVGVGKSEAEINQAHDHLSRTLFPNEGQLVGQSNAQKTALTTQATQSSSLSFMARAGGMIKQGVVSMVAFLKGCAASLTGSKTCSRDNKVYQAPGSKPATQHQAETMEQNATTASTSTRPTGLGKPG